MTQAEAVPEPAPFAGAAGALAQPAAGAAPLSDLARAFQANARALEGVGALQAELLGALERADRSELVLASAQGLNESFRQLATIQRALLQRLEAPPPAPAGGGRLVPMLLLGLVGVVVLATWVIVGTWREYVASQPDPRALTEHAVGVLEAGRAEAEQGARDETQRLQSLMSESEQRVRTLQERLDAEREAAVERSREVAAKEAELDALRRQAIAAQNEALKKLSLEDEVRELTAQVALAEPRTRALGEELEAERRENARLRRRIASSEMGLPEEPEAPAAPVAPPPNLAARQAPPPAPAATASRSGASSGGDGQAPLPPVRPPSAVAPAAALAAPTSAPESEGTRDPAILSQVQASLNTLLDVSRGQRPDHWQIRRVDGLTQDRLRGVLAERYDATGRVVEVVEAREARVWIERDARRAMIEFRQGVRTVNGVRSDFHAGSIASIAAEGEHVQLFSQSGLTLIGSR